MKKKLILFFTILVCLNLFGCSLKDNIQNKPKEDTNITSTVEDDDEKEIAEMIPIEKDDMIIYDSDNITSVDNDERTDMKKEFEKPVAEVVEFENEDIITSSSVETPIVPPGV